MDIKRVAGAVLVAGLCVTGLSSAAGASAPKVEAPAAVNEAAPAAPVTSGLTDTAYLSAARALVIRTKLAALADADLIGLGATFCTAITNGATKADFTKSAELMDVPIGTYRSLVALAEITYCPQNAGFRL